MEENNKMDISRRGFLKTAALAGAAMAMPSGLGKVFASEAKQAETSDVVDIDAARIKGHRVLGTGKAAFEVSALGFGVMGMTYNRSQHPDKKECIRLLHEAVERGVTLFDTAIIYGPLTNENLAGEALSEFKGRINVTTKFGHEVIDGKGTGRQDSRPATIRRYCEESLRRLRLDSLPMFYQHRADPNTPAEEVAATIADLIKEGKVQRWGMCEVSAETIRKAHAICPLTAIQSEYHLMHRLVHGEVNLRMIKTVSFNEALKKPHAIVEMDLKKKILAMLELGYDTKRIKNYFEENKDTWQDINPSKIKVYYFTKEIGRAHV